MKAIFESVQAIVKYRCRHSHGATAVVLPALVAVLLAVVACSGPEPIVARPDSTEWIDRTTMTASYRVVLSIGPSVTLDSTRTGAKMTMVDREWPVNRHIEVHVFDTDGGVVVNREIPIVRIGDLTTGASRGLATAFDLREENPHITACLLTSHRAAEPHFGDNLFLSGGSYVVTVGVGNETAAFEVSL